MFLKVVVLIAQVCMIKTAFGQCIGNIGNTYGIEKNPCGCSNTQLPRPQLTIPDSGIVSASCDGSLNVQVSALFAPGTLSVQSENQIQGPLSVYGTLPFFSAVAFEESLPTHGSGEVTYQCGDGRVSILEENTPASGYDRLAPGSFGEGYDSFGAGWGISKAGINGINNCVQSVTNGGYGLNKGIECGSGY